MGRRQKGRTKGPASPMDRGPVWGGGQVAEVKPVPGRPPNPTALSHGYALLLPAPRLGQRGPLCSIATAKGTSSWGSWAQPL